MKPSRMNERGKMNWTDAEWSNYFRAQSKNETSTSESLEYAQMQQNERRAARNDDANDQIHYSSRVLPSAFVTNCWTKKLLLDG